MRFLGIDLGGTKILAAVVDPSGGILARDQIATPATEGTPAIIQAMVTAASRATSQVGMTMADITAVGIGAAGLSSPEAGILYTSPNLPGWQDVPLRDIIAQELGKPTFLINDARAAALGELYFGAARGARNFIYITISTGIGGGIVINGEIYLGRLGTAGEVGHMTIADDGPLCTCGNRGCWEALASGSALEREARERIQKGAKTIILDYASNLEQITAEIIQRAAEHGDTLARELVARIGYYFGVGLANLINIFNPELIVIGGGLANMGDMLLEPAIKTAGERAFRQPFQAVRFVRAELGGNSGVLGAAIFAQQQLKRTSGKAGKKTVR